jgi:hypothetical protein
VHSTVHKIVHLNLGFYPLALGLEKTDPMVCLAVKLLSLRKYNLISLLP